MNNAYKNEYWSTYEYINELSNEYNQWLVHLLFSKKETLNLHKVRYYDTITSRNTDRSKAIIRNVRNYV